MLFSSEAQNEHLYYSRVEPDLGVVRLEVDMVREGLTSTGLLNEMKFDYYKPPTATYGDYDQDSMVNGLIRRTASTGIVSAEYGMERDLEVVEPHHYTNSAFYSSSPAQFLRRGQGQQGREKASLPQWRFRNSCYAKLAIIWPAVDRARLVVVHLLTTTTTTTVQPHPSDSLTGPRGEKREQKGSLGDLPHFPQSLATSRGL